MLCQPRPTTQAKARSMRRTLKLRPRRQLIIYRQKMRVIALMRLMGLAASRKGIY